MRFLMHVSAAAVLFGLLFNPASAATFMIDFGNTSVIPSGWNSVDGSNYFNGSGAATDPTAITLDVNDDGSMETIHVGYDSFSSATDRDRQENASWTFSQEFKDVLRDFSGANSPASSNQLILWGMPEGEYEVKVWLRDDDFGSGTYQLTGLQDDGDVLFEVVHGDFLTSDPDSASALGIVSTIQFDPPDGLRTWESASSLVFVNDGSNTPIAGLQITFLPANVPEPASLALWSLLGVIAAACMWRQCPKQSRRAE